MRSAPGQSGERHSAFPALRGRVGGGSVDGPPPRPSPAARERGKGVYSGRAGQVQHLRVHRQRRRLHAHHGIIRQHRAARPLAQRVALRL
jgi:hypothetical protein